MVKVRALAGNAVRRREGRFLVEGPQAVREVVRFAPASIRDVYLTTEAASRNPEIFAEAQKAGLHVHGSTPEVVAAMSGDAQGVLAVVRTWSMGFEGPPAAPTLVAILSDVRDPGNAGAAIRAADAAGADAVILAGECVDPFSPKVVRSSAGSLFHLPIVTGVTLSDAVAAVRAWGLRVLATDGSGETTLGGPGADAHALAVPTAWVFGNEAWGLSEAERALADSTVRIPIYGHAESLNLAQAVAVFLFATTAMQRGESR